MAAKNRELSVQRGLQAKVKSVQQELRESQKAVENEEWVKAITLDCWLDSLLENLLERAFSQQSKKVAGLFDCNILQKAKFAYALGLINKTTLRDLKLINKIRNTFAHSRNTGFADPEIQKKCKGLSTAKGHKVTAKTSYKIYKDAANRCRKNIIISKIELWEKATISNLLLQ